MAPTGNTFKLDDLGRIYSQGLWSKVRAEDRHSGWKQCGCDHPKLREGREQSPTQMGIQGRGSHNRSIRISHWK